MYNSAVLTNSLEKDNGSQKKEGNKEEGKEGISKIQCYLSYRKRSMQYCVELWNFKNAILGVK